MELTLNEAEKFVSKAPGARWDGWTLNIYQPEPNAFLKTNGVFYNGRWCLRRVVEPNFKGKYVISERNRFIATRSWF